MMIFAYEKILEFVKTETCFCGGDLYFIETDFVLDGGEKHPSQNGKCRTVACQSCALRAQGTYADLDSALLGFIETAVSGPHPFRTS